MPKIIEKYVIFGIFIYFHLKLNLQRTLIHTLYIT